ncbi:MAG TPA: sialidase family protein [Candidatus Krumholzibacteria bacterium]|nr:sialidase family protein [Candidatus Krumholzibacteria bacterium]HRX52609.1 sialidase family protein [Candidatus Krumholzibacteria bacterium]
MLRIPIAAAILLLAGAAAARPPAIQVSYPSTYDAEELSIAIDPTDPDVLVAGGNIAYRFRSTDGGLTWSQATLSSTLGVWGDPLVAFSPDGRCHFAHLSNPAGGSWLDRIVVQTSLDGGATWDDGVGVGLNPPRDQDKEDLTADDTDSPWRGNLYLAWTEFDVYGSSAPQDSSRLRFAVSSDHGATWTVQTIGDAGGDCVDDDATVEGASIAVGPQGEVYVAWSSHGSIVMDRSLDGGLTFGADTVICDQPGGWAFDVPGIYRANGFGTLSCDRSGSPHRGRLSLVFSDQRAGTDDTDVLICTSDDGGQSWTAPRPVHAVGAPSHQFFPAAALDPLTGDLHVVYYDRAATAGNATDVVTSTSRDGGATFSHVTVSDASFTPNGNVFFGDYIGIDARGGRVHPLWMSMDLSGVLRVHTAALDFATGVEPAVRRAMLLQGPAVSASGRARLSFRTFADGPVSLEIFDVRGARVRTLVREDRAAGAYTEEWDGRDAAGRAAGAGMYLAVVRAGAEQAVRKVILSR